MVDLSLLSRPAPYHILSYGTLLGSQIFQSFIGGPLAFKSLPRPQFASLQSAIFPVYFSLQSALPVVLALTYPGTTFQSSSLSGVLSQENRLSVLAPLAIMCVTGLANLLVVGPATTKIMRDRKSQEYKDGKKSYDPPPHSKEMAKLNKSFAKMHGISSLINLASIIATMWYGVVLSERL